MKKTTYLFLAFLFTFGFQAGAEEVSVKVASDRAAVFQAVDSSGDPTMSGTVKGAANLKEGKSGLRADLTLKDSAELKDTQADLYAHLTGKTIEAIGFLDAKVPADPTAPKVFNVDVTSVTEGDQAAANFKIDLEAPTAGEPAPKGSGKFAVKGDFKAFKSSGDFDISGAAVKASDFPFQKFELTITETGAGDAQNPVKTAIAFTIAAPKGSPMAANLATLPQAAPMLEQNLKSAQIKYEGIDFPAPTEEGANMVSKGSLTLIDLRTTIKQFLPIISSSMQGGPEVLSGLEQIIDARADKFSFTLEVQEGSAKGSMALDGSNLEKFFSGYLTLMPAISEASNAQFLAEAGEFGPLLEPLMRLNTEQAVESLKLLATSAMTLDGQMNFSLEPKGAEGAEQTVAFAAEGQMSCTNYQDYVQKAKAAGLPVAEKAVAKLALNLKDQTSVTGNMYLFTDGDIVNYYKSMLAKAAKESQAPEDVQKAITDLNLEELGMKLTLKGDKLQFLARSNTSDLSKIAGLILKQANPSFQADLTGGAVDINIDEQGQGKSDLKIFFANFMPGQDAAAIKETLGLPSSTTVALDAAAADVALVAVEQPEIGIDGNLAQVQSEGQKLLAASPSEVGGGGSGGGGKWGLIALGVLLLAGVGGFLAFGKKS